MKQTTRLLALSALVLALMLGVFGAPALEAPSVAFAQGQVPAAPTGLTATRSGASTINLSWNGVTGAVRYQVWYWTEEEGFQRLDGGEPMPHTTTTFAHQNVVADRLYVYQVHGVNAQGDRGPRSNRANEVGGQNAPGRPVLRPTAGYLLNVIEWDPVPGAASYRLYAWDQSWSQIGGTLTGTSYTHPNLTAGQTYYYEARAVNANGVIGAVSAQVSATVLSSPTITAPVNLSAGTVPQDMQVTLTWDAPPGAGTTITGYEYRYAASTATLPATWSNAGNDLTETITGLTNGTQYTFQVRAMSSSGMGPPASVMATPAAVPDAPVLAAAEGYRMVTLTWDAPDNNGAAITVYRIEILNSQNQWVAESTVLGTTATSYSYVDRSLNDSTVYTYQVIAVNAAGDSSASNSAAATTLAQPAQKPGPPASISAAAGAGMVTLTWTTPLFNGGSEIIRYEYRYKKDSATSWGGWMSAMLELTVAVKSLDPGELYDFEVRAVNSATPPYGDAVNTDDVADADRTPTDTGPTAVPSLRTPVVGSFSGGTVAGHESRATVTLSWTQLPESANGGVAGAVTAYEICYKKLADSAWMRWVQGDPGFGTPVLTGSLYSAVHGADAAKLDPGTIYQYRARGLNSVATAGDAATCDHWDGAWSNVVTAAMTPYVMPNAPTLHPAAGDTTTTPPQAAWSLNVNTITIRWTKPTANGGRDITNYEVWMGTATVTDDAEIAALTPTVTNLPASRLEYISIGLRAETPYFYRVRARNGSGDNYVGAWSEEQTASTTVTQTGTPEAPTLSTPTAEADGDVPLSWTPPTNRGTSPITSYEIQYQRTDDGGDTPGTEDTTDLEDWGDAVTATSTTLSWTHMQAPGLSRYAYRVRAVNSSGAGAWSTVAGNVEVAARAPAKPTLTATELGMDEIMLRWNIPEDNGTPITGFAIQQWDPDPDDNADTDDAAWDTANNLLAPTGGTDLSGDATLTVFAVTGLDAGTKYYFRIQALPGGVWSAENMADAASDTTMAGLPAQPDITVTAGTGDDADSITITWTAPGSGGSDLLGYQLRVAEWAGSGWAALENGSPWVLEANLAATATMYKDEGLKPGTRYYYILAAQNSSGYGAWSAEKSVMTESGAPEAPTLVATPTGADSIKLTWNVPNANGATITGYELVIWDTASSAWDTTNQLGTDTTVTEFEDTGLEAGTKYYYRIRALPQTGDAGWSATNMSDGASATTYGDTPGRPTWPAGDFTATASSLVLTWEAPNNTGGSAITGYKLQIWSGGRWVDEATLGNVLTYTDMNLNAGTKYYYRVLAINSQGEGLASAAKPGTTTATNPDAPVLMAAPASMTTIRLTWTVPDDNGTAITGYELQRFGTSAWDTTNLLGDTPADTIGLTLFVDSDLDPGTTYHYRIRATPQTGDNDGWSVSKSATTVAGAPGRPTDVTLTADGQYAVDITWTAPDDNGSAIVRYVLERYTTETRWVVVRHDLPSTSTSYKDTGLTADTRYVYRIRAVNRAADNNGLGKYSTIDFVKTAK